MWLKIPVDLETDAAHAYLLDELDRWIGLGLLSEEQVIGIGHKLCSQLPIPYQVPVEERQALPEETAAEAVRGEATTAARSPLFSGFKSRLMQSFLAEVSVLWLLFLGVFLVIVSSGVLAASQWQSFSPLGQYAILLVYTLAFGGASCWAAGQAKLQTTAQMLKAATLLLIPLNLWMMDDLRLAHTAVGLASLASIGLSVLTLALASSRRTGLNLLGLSWLHWGWGLGPWPVLATYLGTLGSAVNLVWAADNTQVSETDEPQGSVSQSASILVAIALLILLTRSLWIAQVPLSQLGLALGVGGWMLLRLHYPLWPQVGAGLMFFGWLVTIPQQPMQALGVSGLAVWLLLRRLKHQPEIGHQLRTLYLLWLIGLQACGLVWLTLPIGLRQTLLTVVERFGIAPVNAIHFAGLWMYGYVGVMLLGAKSFRQRDQIAWAQLTEKLAIGISPVLVLCTLPQAQSFLLMLSLIGQTLTLGMITRLRRPATKWLIYSTHLSAIVTCLSGVDIISGWLGNWSTWQYALIFLGLTTVEWCISVADTRYPQCRQSAWYLGIGLSVIAYSLLLNTWSSWFNLSWLVVPGVLTWLLYRREASSPQQITTLAVVALGGQLFLLSSWQTATIALFTGAGLLLIHSCRWPRQPSLPVLAVGFAVGGGHTGALWLLSPAWPEKSAQFLLVVAFLASILSILARQLSRQSRPLLQAYGAASQGWSQTLAIALHLGLTLITALVYSLGPNFIDWIIGASGTELFLRYGIAAVILLLSRLVSKRLTNLNYWELAFGVGLLVTMGLLLWQQESSPQILGAAMVALGLLTQLLGTLSVARRQPTYPSSWHYIPLTYGALGLALGHLSFTAATGFYAIVVGIVTLAIGSRQADLHPLRYGGLGLLSLGIYELVIYRMLQTSGGQPGDGFTLLALVGSAIAALYLLCHRWVQRYSQLTATEVNIVSLFHWLLAVTLAAIAMVSGHSRLGLWLWLSTASLLILYAGLRGNYHWVSAPELNDAPSDRRPNQQQWTWSGLIIATISLPYGTVQLLPNPTFIGGWGALLTCGLSLIILRLPWQRWGWPIRPWQRMALSWPVMATLLSILTVKTQSLLLVGAFYALMAKQWRAVRLSYISLGLLNWSLLRYLINQGWMTPLWLGTMLGLSVLYILEVDSHWQPVSARQERHRLRSFATLLIGLTALFQAETTSPLFIGLSLLISGGFIGIGLMMQVRAYLYTGTLTFVLQILRTITIFISTDGRLLWAIGILLGIALIWVAATFEARRTQISQLLNHWSDLLGSWE
ncbi:membrane protein [Leptolyngbya sp. Heron Island J]|nr:membrane protein [Leptolyngbya sp. Heron Island J]